MRKFDFAIGNPAYQAEVENEGDRANPLYDKFMDGAFQIADKVEMITPARFLFDAGQTSKAWNSKMLNDDHFKVLLYKADASKVFPNTIIVGGVAISYRDETRHFGKIGFFTPYEELNNIMQKVRDSTSDFLDSLVSARGNYRLTALFFQDYPEAESRLGTGTGNMVVSNIFEKIPEAFSDNPIEEESIRILGRIGGVRAYRFINRKYIIPNDYLCTYNVLISEADGAAGRIGVPIPARIIGKPEYAKANEGATDTFISIGKFSTEEESKNLGKFLLTKFSRAMIGVKKATQHNPRSVWGFVPIQDFTSSSDINWNASIANIDKQLYKKYRLSQEEIDFIETHVKEMT